MYLGVKIILPYAEWRILRMLKWRKTRVLAGGTRGGVRGGPPTSFGVLGKITFPIVLLLGRYVLAFEFVVLIYVI